MIEAMARAGAVLDEPRYIESAIRAATFIETQLWKSGRLQRHYRNGTAPVPGYLDDYAFLGRGHLALYETTFETRWLEAALRTGAGTEPALFASGRKLLDDGSRCGNPPRPGGGFL